MLKESNTIGLEDINNKEEDYVMSINFIQTIRSMKYLC